MKKLQIFIIISFIFIVNNVYANQTVKVIFFYGEGCPHCNKEKPFLYELQKKYKGLEIQSYEVWKYPANARLLTDLMAAHSLKVSGVPVTFIGDFAPIVGFQDKLTTGKEIESLITLCQQKSCPDPLDRLFAKHKLNPPSTLQKTQPFTSNRNDAMQSNTLPAQTDKTSKQTDKSSVINIPLIGQYDVSGLSLPILTIVLAGLDSFNPCAFFVLLTLLGMLTHAKTKSKILIIGGVFVFFSGFVYFLFMAAWLNLFLYMGELKAVTLVAGCIAMFMGVVNIKDFFYFKKGLSLSIPESAKPGLYKRMRGLLNAESLPTMIIGTATLSLAANSYELLCTAGLPMVFTRALTLSHLSITSYYTYLVFYNVIYVIPLFIIVMVFYFTLGAKKLTERQGQILKLISGMMMVSLGAVLLFKPDALNNLVISILIITASLVTSWLIILLKPEKNETVR